MGATSCGFESHSWHADVAQLVEQYIRNVWVSGSIPLVGLLEAFFDQYSGFGLYIIMLVALLATGFGLPLSEDFLLMVIGYMVQDGRMGLVPGFMTAYIGSVLSDLIMFNIGYHYGESVRKHRFILRVMSHGRQEKILQKFRRYGDKFILFARFIAGLRAPTFLSAGISRMKPLRFVMLDGLAALLSVPLFVGLGYAFGNHIELIEADISELRRILTVLVIGGIGVFILMNYLKLFKDKPDLPEL